VRSLARGNHEEIETRSPTLPAVQKNCHRKGQQLRRKRGAAEAEALVSSGLGAAENLPLANLHQLPVNLIPSENRL